MIEKLLLVRVRLWCIEAIVLGGQKAWLGERLGLRVELGVDCLYDEARRSAGEVILAVDKPSAHLDSPVEVAHLLAAQEDSQPGAAARWLRGRPLEARERPSLAREV